MADVFPKFIIEDGNLIISKVTFHKEMVLDKTKVKGGGSFKYHELENGKRMLVFYGESHDFGKAKFEDIKGAIEAGEVYSNPYSSHSIIDKWEFGYESEFGDLIDLKTGKLL